MRKTLKLWCIRILRIVLKVFYIFPVKNNVIIFESFEGRQYSCNPKYLFLHMKERYGEKYRYIWVLNDKSLCPQGCTCVEKFRFNEKHRMTIRTQLQLHEDIPLLGLVANFTEQKNHVFLIKVFSELLKHVPNAELVLLGGNSNDETAYEKLKIFADSLGISENIHFMGAVKNVNEYYSAMDIFVMPSLWEGLPYAGIEAQASCLPCLFSDSISNELTVSQWANFFPLKNGEKAWAERIHELLTTNNCHTRSQFLEKTREEIREHGYDLKENVVYIENLYMSLEVAQWQT